MIKRFCDLCEKEVASPKRLLLPNTSKNTNRGEETIVINEYRGVDLFDYDIYELCPDCYREIVGHIDIIINKFTES